MRELIRGVPQAEELLQFLQRFRSLTAADHDALDSARFPEFPDAEWSRAEACLKAAMQKDPALQELCAQFSFPRSPRRNMPTWYAEYDTVRFLAARHAVPASAYDRMTLEWRCAIGPIHPEDPEPLSAVANEAFWLARGVEQGYTLDEARVAIALATSSDNKHGPLR